MRRCFTYWKGVTRRKLAPPTSNGTLVHLVRTSINGSIDNSFSAQLGIEGIGARVLAQTDGKIIATGQFLNANGATHLNLARFNSDGTRDPGFSPPPVARNIIVTGLDIQTDGKILVAGRSPGPSALSIAWRLNADGSLDSTLPFPPDLRWTSKLFRTGSSWLGVGILRRYNPTSERYAYPWLRRRRSRSCCSRMEDPISGILLK